MTTHKSNNTLVLLAIGLSCLSIGLHVGSYLKNRSERIRVKEQTEKFVAFNEYKYRVLDKFQHDLEFIARFSSYPTELKFGNGKLYGIYRNKDFLPTTVASLDVEFLAKEEEKINNEK